MANIKIFFLWQYIMTLCSPHSVSKHGYINVWAASNVRYNWSQLPSYISSVATNTTFHCPLKRLSGSDFMLAVAWDSGDLAVLCWKWQFDSLLNRHCAGWIGRVLYTLSLSVISWQYFTWSRSSVDNILIFSLHNDIIREPCLQKNVNENQ